MLVLRRTLNENIFIETDSGLIRIEICRIQKSGVRLGIECPDSIGIYRGEEYERLKQTKGKYADDIRSSSATPATGAPDDA